MTDNDTSRCDGRCCKAFVLSGYTVQEMQRYYDNEIRLLTEGMWDWIKPLPAELAPKHWPPGRVDGIATWWPWMVYLGRFTHHPTTGRLNPSEHGVDYFTCLQHDPETGDCRVYDRRPHFCKSYGVSCACEHEGCTWQGAWKLGEPDPRPLSILADVGKPDAVDVCCGG